MPDLPANPDQPQAVPQGPSPNAEDELFAKVSGILGGWRELHAQAVTAYRPEVDDIIRRRSRDINHIEHTLDGLLTFCGDAAALALFKRLCRYYWDIDPEATARQVMAYRDWFEPEEEGDDKPG